MTCTQNETTDVVVVGAGPAGLAAATEAGRLPGRKIVVLEKGEDLHKRRCPALAHGSCGSCQVCSLLCGVGGSSGLLGGKLCYFPAGSRLADHVGRTSAEANKLASRFLTNEPLFGSLHACGCSATCGPLTLKPYWAERLLSGQMSRLFERVRGRLLSTQCTLRTGADVLEVERGAGDWRFSILYRQHGIVRRINVRDAVILAVGRSGVSLVDDVVRAFGLQTRESAVDVGVRVEFRSRERIHVRSVDLEDPKWKLDKRSEGDVRTLCWCRGGQLSVVDIGGMRVVDGHFAHALSAFTAVSVVARLPVPSGGNPLASARELLGSDRLKQTDTPVWEPLFQFLGVPGTRRTQRPGTLGCREGSIRAILGDRLADGISSFVVALDDISDYGLCSPRAKVYAPVVDNFWPTPVLDEGLMTSAPGLFFAGDITGLGRGIVQAFFSGAHVGRGVSRAHGCVTTSREELAVVR